MIVAYMISVVTSCDTSTIGTSFMLIITCVRMCIYIYIERERYETNCNNNNNYNNDNNSY